MLLAVIAASIDILPWNLPLKRIRSSFLSFYLYQLRFKIRIYSFPCNFSVASRRFSFYLFFIRTKIDATTTIRIRTTIIIISWQKIFSLFSENDRSCLSKHGSRHRHCDRKIRLSGSVNVKFIRDSQRDCQIANCF